MSMNARMIIAPLPHYHECSLYDKRKAVIACIKLVQNREGAGFVSAKMRRIVTVKKRDKLSGGNLSVLN